MGFIKHHRSFLPVAIFSIGFLFLVPETILRRPAFTPVFHCRGLYHQRSFLQLPTLPPEQNAIHHITNIDTVY